METYKIDAKDNTIGRVANKAAVLLMGKNNATYQRNKIPDVRVEIVNASQVKIHPPKLKAKIYKDYSGHTGGQKERTLAHVIEKNGMQEVFKRAVHGMLPSNRLRARMMKNLVIIE